MPKIEFPFDAGAPWRGYSTREQIAAMSDDERLDAAMAYAEHAWHQPKVEDYADWMHLCDLATDDGNIYDFLVEEAKEQESTLPVEVKAALFHVLLRGAPKGHKGLAARNREHRRLRAIGAVLINDYGFKRTRNEGTKEASKGESAASILRDIGVALSERSIEGILDTQ